MCGSRFALGSEKYHYKRQYRKYHDENALNNGQEKDIIGTVDKTLIQTV
jgi:hypothetical protein